MLYVFESLSMGQSGILYIFVSPSEAKWNLVCFCESDWSFCIFCESECETKWLKRMLYVFVSLSVRQSGILYVFISLGETKWNVVCFYESECEIKWEFCTFLRV